MNLPLRIALRYLFSGRKSRGVSGRISAVSVAGMAIGTAALIVILSVYNGFDSLIRTNERKVTPDFVVRASQGKTFVPDSSLLAGLGACENILSVNPVLRDVVYARKGSRYYAVEAIGQEGATGIFCSSEIGAGSLTLYYPERGRAFSPSNPAVKSLDIDPAGVFRASGKSVTLPAALLRGLLGLPDGSVSEMEVIGEVSERELRSIITGSGLDVLGREAQNPTLYKMLRFEKLVIFLILFFVLVIVAFNIGACLTMLRIEKDQDMAILGAMGLDIRSQRRIFRLEGLLISVGGMLAGLVAGLLLLWAQSAFGLVRMPGLLGQPYPVHVELSDVLLTAAGVVAIGAIVSINCVSLRREKIQQTI